MSTTVNNSGGIGILGLLTVLFVGLKLTDYIDWSWWWVLAPLWMPLCFVLTLIIFIAAISAVTDK